MVFSISIIEPISKQNSNCSAISYIWLNLFARCCINAENHYIQLSFSCCRFHRNHSLKEQLKALRVKEAEDMKALEDMVQRVEENLVTTTVSDVPGAQTGHTPLQLAVLLCCIVELLFVPTGGWQFPQPYHLVTFW